MKLKVKIESKVLEGKDSHMKKEKLGIAFICVENARRSQMAQGFAETLGRGKVEVNSVGSRPSSRIDPLMEVPVSSAW